MITAQAAAAQVEAERVHLREHHGFEVPEGVAVEEVVSGLADNLVSRAESLQTDMFVMARKGRFSDKVVLPDIGDAYANVTRTRMIAFGYYEPDRDGDGTGTEHRAGTKYRCSLYDFRFG